MAEAKLIDTVSKASDANPDKKEDGVSEKKEVKWMVVYTDYGYGEVNLEEFKKSIQETTDRMTEAGQSIQEYLLQKHQEMRELKDKEDKEQDAGEDPRPSAMQEPVLPQNDVAKEESKDAASDAEAQKKREEEERRLKEEQEKKRKEDEDSRRRDEDLEMIRQIQLTDEQKKSLREIYDQIIYVKFRWGGHGYLKRSSIKSKIAVNIKTLHGERKTHKVNVSIIDLVSKIKDKLNEIEPEEMKKYPQVKLVYPMGQIKILPLDQTIASQQIKDNSTLVLMGLQSYSFNPEVKDPNLKLDDGNTKVTRLNENPSRREHMTVFCNQSFSSSSHYFQVRIESVEGQHGIFIGIAIQQGPVTLGSMKEVYGVIAPDEKLFYRYPTSHKWEMPMYGNRKGNGDLVGILVEFGEDGYAKMTLFKNGKLLGSPYTRIKPGTYYPCVSLAGGKNVVIIENNVQAPDKPYENGESLYCPPETEYKEGHRQQEEEEE